MATQAQQIEDQDRVEVRTRSGTLPVHKESLLDFPEGLPGFDELHQFALLHNDGNTSIFYLQSLQDPDVRIPVTSPHWFRVDYSISLSDDEMAMLQLDDPEDAALLVTIAEQESEPSGLRPNFKAPIILNTARQVGLQKPISDPQGSLVIKSQ
jgi:flagellar assembly factor FliW